MTPIDQDRVVEILVPDAPSLGTGYLLGAGCVLTAHHVVKDYGDEGIKCRLLGRYNGGDKTWALAQPIWSNAELDVALLQAPSLVDISGAVPLVAPLNVDQRMQCRAYGFPKFRRQELRGKSTFYPYVAEGWIKPLASKQAGELLVEIEGATPSTMQGWQGMSGAAIFTEAEGTLVGVVLKGPQELGAAQLTAIALAPLLEQHPDFVAALETHNGLRLERWQPTIESPDAATLCDLEFKLTALQLRKKQSDITSIELDYQIRQCQGDLEILSTSSDALTHRASLPEMQLLDLLTELEATEPDLFWQAWGRVANGMAFNGTPTVKESYALLYAAKDPEAIPRFLTVLYHTLAERDRPLHLASLTTLAASLYELDLIATAAPVQPEVTDPAVALGGDQCATLLVKIKSTHCPKATVATYAVTAWLIRDRHSYHQRFKEAEASFVDSEGYSEKLLDAVSLESATAHPVDQQNDLKDQLSELITTLWEDRTLGLPDLRPEVVFCVPSTLLLLDYHNLDLSEFMVLGLELPVSVSCLERYEATLQRYRTLWMQRWQVLEESDDGCSSYIETYDPSVVDLSCPKKLYRWLSKQDSRRGDNRRVAGMGVYEPRTKLKTEFQNLLKNGLPIVLWSRDSLKQPAIDALQRSLNVTPTEALDSIRRYRAVSDDDDAGVLSVLFDNPYLPPPDAEIDYY